MGDGESVGSFSARAETNARRPDVHRCGPLSGAHRSPVARSPGALRLLEDRLQPVLKLVVARPLGGNLQGAPDRRGRRSGHSRCLRCSSPPGRCGRKGGIISNALGHSRGGFTTKVHALVDRKGRPLHIELTQGQRHESSVAESIIAGHARGKALIADTGYDSDAIRRQLHDLGMKAVIHPNPSRKTKPRLDRRRYAWRYRVEVFFHSLKRFRAVATRFEKTARNYLSLLQLASAKLWLDDLLPETVAETWDSP